MNTRLKQFIAAENISQSQFADKIQVVRASVSHVLSGRNNPGYDFIKAIMKSYPNLNIDWLILGKGKMYKEVSQKETSIIEEHESWVPLSDGDLFSEENTDFIAHDQTTIPTLVHDDHNIGVNIPELPQEKFNRVSQSPIIQRKVSKVMIFFDDGTYQEM